MKENNISIREFQIEDIPSITDLTLTLGYETTIEQMTTRMKTIAQLDNYWTFVAVLEETIVGYIGLNKNYFWEQDGHFIRIQALVVSKEHRRFGIGQKLIEQAEKLSNQINASLIVLNCGNKDERKSAHQFYPRMGFEAKSTGYAKKIK
ncbi:GNAT family N-acetyltransferase [Pedobacter frigiditerrae]|uniref:GNAT family N-acetyltransferase n=1 Tax=Pedobacter frigiditerrae TaxID=2530452 RepID=UPI00292ED7F2|nr:GNAT family N-acetyltransferase [Pedobacter frigiditerrae]